MARVQAMGGLSRKKGLLIWIGILSFMFLIHPGSVSSSDIFAQAGVIRPHTRKEAPDFKLEDINGKAFQLSRHKGKIILLNFWATWCMPCREEMPSFEKLWKKLGPRGLLVVAISVDISRKDIKSFVRKYHISYPILIDNKGEIRKLYEIRVLPTTYIIGRDGKFTGKILGARNWAGKKIERLLREIDSTLFLPLDSLYRYRTFSLYPKH